MKEEHRRRVCPHDTVRPSDRTSPLPTRPTLLIIPTARAPARRPKGHPNCQRSRQCLARVRFNPQSPRAISREKSGYRLRAINPRPRLHSRSTRSAKDGDCGSSIPNTRSNQVEFDLRSNVMIGPAKHAGRRSSTEPIIRGCCLPAEGTWSSFVAL